MNPGVCQQKKLLQLSLCNLRFYITQGPLTRSLVSKYEFQVLPPLRSLRILSVACLFGFVDIVEKRDSIQTSKSWVNDSIFLGEWPEWLIIFHQPMNSRKSMGIPQVLLKTTDVAVTSYNHLPPAGVFIHPSRCFKCTVICHIGSDVNLVVRNSSRNMRWFRVKPFN